MRSSRSLSVLQQRAARRLARLKPLLGQGSSSDLDRRTAYVVIEAHATWASYCRFFYLSCALGARDATGVSVLPPGVRFATEEEAITFAVHTLNPRKRGQTGPWSTHEEPTWYDSSDFRRAVQALNPANVGSVISALALAPASFRQLTTFRNFYAHRGRGTVRKAQAIARSYVLNPSQHPTLILNDYPVGRPQVLLADLLDDIKTVVGLMN